MSTGFFYNYYNNVDFVVGRPFVKYCMKRIHFLRQHDITPIVVFDGANLPMKAKTEQERKAYATPTHTPTVMI